MLINQYASYYADAQENAILGQIALESSLLFYRETLPVQHTIDSGNSETYGVLKGEDEGGDNGVVAPIHGML